MIFWITAGLVAALIAGLLVMSTAPQKFAWRQRMTVTVDAPAGPVTGASVVQVNVSYIANRTMNFGTPVSSAIDPDFRLNELPDIMQRLKTVPLDRPTPVGAGAFPMLVTFDDIADPMSVRLVNPAALDATFGPGIKLDTVTLAMTDAAVTSGTVLALLPWLAPDPEPALGPPTGRTTSLPDYRCVHMGDFIRGKQ